MDPNSMSYLCVSTHSAVKTSVANRTAATAPARGTHVSLVWWQSGVVLFCIGGIYHGRCREKRLEVLR